MHTMTPKPDYILTIHTDRKAMITYTIGDATKPEGPGPKLIAHICNDIGRWGRGFVLAVSNRWAAPRIAYKCWHSEEDSDFGLGQIQTIPVEPGIAVVNMIAQKGTRTPTNQHPIRYPALQLCLNKLALEASQRGAAIHMPRIGTGLAGGNWNQIEPLIQQELQDHQIVVYDLPVKQVYDLPKR